MPTFDRNSKADTRLLLIRAGGGAAALAVDQSQWRTDLTNNTTYLTSTNALLGVQSPREISIVAKLDNNDTGYLINFGNVAGTSYIFRIEVSGASSLVRFHANSATNLATLTPPNLGASVRTYLIHWSTDYDEFVNGYYSEMALCDVATGSWAVTRVTHAQPLAPAGGWQLNVSGYGAGVTGFSGGLSNVESVRISERWHPVVEASEDWYSESSSPTVTGVQPVVELAPCSEGQYEDEDSSDQINKNLLRSATFPTFAGPAEILAVINAHSAKKRLFSPILNLAINSPPTLQNTYLPANFYRSWGNSSPVMKLFLGHVWARPLPLGAFTARVRVHVQTWIQAGAPGGTSVSVGFQMISLDALPKSANAINPLGFQTAVVTSTTNHGPSGIGQWLDLGELALRQAPEGLTFLLLSHRFGSGTGASFLRARVKAIVVEPYGKV